MHKERPLASFCAASRWARPWHVSVCSRDCLATAPWQSTNVNVLAVLGMPVGVDALEHAGGLSDLDKVSVGVAQIAPYLRFAVKWLGKKLCPFGFAATNRRGTQRLRRILCRFGANADGIACIQTVPKGVPRSRHDLAWVRDFLPGRNGGTVSTDLRSV